MLQSGTLGACGGFQVEHWEELVAGEVPGDGQLGLGAAALHRTLLFNGPIEQRNGHQVLPGQPVQQLRLCQLPRLILLQPQCPCVRLLVRNKTSMASSQCCATSHYHCSCMRGHLAELLRHVVRHGASLIAACCCGQEELPRRAVCIATHLSPSLPDSWSHAKPAAPHMIHIEAAALLQPSHQEGDGGTAVGRDGCSAHRQGASPWRGRSPSRRAAWAR